MNPLEFWEVIKKKLSYWVQTELLVTVEELDDKSTYGFSNVLSNCERMMYEWKLKEDVPLLNIRSCGSHAMFIDDRALEKLPCVKIK